MFNCCNTKYFKQGLVLLISLEFYELAFGQGNFCHRCKHFSFFFYILKVLTFKYKFLPV